MRSSIFLVLFFVMTAIGTTAFASGSPMASIVFADKELHEAQRQIADLQGQLVEKDKTISLNDTVVAQAQKEINNCRKDLEQHRSIIDSMKRDVDKLKSENARLSKVILAKNAEIDNAIKVLSERVPSKPSQEADVKRIGKEYVEEALGRVLVSKDDGKVTVSVAADIEQTADARFYGAIMEKRRIDGGKVIYSLDSSRLISNGGVE